MNYIADLARQQLERAKASAPETDVAAAPDEIPDVATGQVYRDGFCLGFTWRIQWVDRSEVFMRLYNSDGEQTDSFLKFPPERWHTFFERQRLSPVA